MPQRARPYTLALLQALSAIGNVSAAFIYLGLGVLQQNDYLGTARTKAFWAASSVPDGGSCS